MGVTPLSYTQTSWPVTLSAWCWHRYNGSVIWSLKMFTSSFKWRVSFLILSTLLWLHTNDIQADCEHSTQWHMYCMTHSLFLNAFLMCGYYRFIFLLNSCTELSWKWSRSLCEFKLDRDKHFLDLSALHKEPEIFRFIDPVVCESRCLEYCR